MLKKLHFRMALVAAFLVASTTLFAQVQLNVIDEYGRPVMDINSSGQGVSLNGYYDFETNTMTSPEDGVIKTSSMNDNGDVFGMIEDDNGVLAVAVRKNGVWTPISAPMSLTENDELYDISENGKWVVGQLWWTMEYGSWGFIYNTETEEFRVMSSPSYQYGAAYAVNNEGIAVGWVQDDVGVRLPCVFMPDESVVIIANGEGQAGAINNEGQVVGTIDGSAFIYDISSEECTTFQKPAGSETLVFTCISDDSAVIVGFAEYGMFTRKPVIFRPETDSEPVMLTNFLAEHEIDAAGVNGTAYKVSSDGNYIGGFSDGPASVASGWAVKLGDSTDSNPIIGKTFEITLYPNPAQEQINFRTSTTIQSVEIYNLAGQKVVSQKVIDGSVNINQLPSGTYMVKAYTENGEISSFKVIKK